MTRLDELKKLIDEEKAKRMGVIREVKSARNRLSYKMADKTAISQLSQISKSSTKSIGFLRRKKEQLEFRIATEAFTIQAEKELIQKKNEIEKELEEAVKSFRLRKKLEFIDGDIVGLNKQLDELEAKIKESDKKLDDLYSELRAITGAAQRRQQQRTERKPQRDQPKQQEVSMADIAIIKEKKSAKQEKEEVDDSVLN
ncbi:MAG: hypothetical protein KGH67_01320 [Candidatus Micrarchaeota archaeon]|nr:hypothetical protein [Candidatus Micrarchaeota archaeon]MDE1859147.1 hypothetical protein [Candidatus Micrarchaeota archaeon]